MEPVVLPSGDNTTNPQAQTQTTTSQFLDYVLEESTFFRVHLFAFTFVPLVSSGIFYACNGQFRISYLDSLFLCYSAMTVTGLATVNLSTLTAWQQVITYLLMLVGDITVVSWIMILVRKHYFRTKCEYVEFRKRFPHHSRTAFLKSISSPMKAFRLHQAVPTRVGETAEPPLSPVFSAAQPTLPGALVDPYTLAEPTPYTKHTAHESDENVISDARTFSSSPRAASILLAPVRSRGIESALTAATAPFTLHQRRLMSIREGVPYPQRKPTIVTRGDRRDATLPGSPASKKYQGLGGFPGPFQLATQVFKRTAPSTYHKLERKMTIPYMTTLEENQVSWLNFGGLVVGRNSDFHTETLSDDQLEEIGGAEYRALRLLSYIVPTYFVVTQLISFIMFAPWLSSTQRYDSVFDAQPRLVQKPWFALFQVMGAYTGGGLSLVDQSMVPFQGAYLMVSAIMFVILAGNHAMPIFLRLVIWIGSKLSREGSDSHQALSFLLDHPRRCFIYLFPSHQTWFLVVCLVGFSIIEWIAFEVLDLGLDAYESLPLGTRIITGLFQGLAARASGFSIVPVASLAPALQFMYLVMMYIAVYPIAMSIRATNVYEERSLGVFDAPPDNEDEESAELSKLAPRQRVGRYISWHLRRQLSVDIWWLVWGVFLVAAIERNSLLDEDKKWFDMFRVLFELVSAFGGIGLSLGFPSDNYSFAGALRPLSKLVVIVIMVRGRHRGLPVAVDRAVLLPSELVVHQNQLGRVNEAGDHLDAGGLLV